MADLDSLLAELEGQIDEPLSVTVPPSQSRPSEATPKAVSPSSPSHATPAPQMQQSAPAPKATSEHAQMLNPMNAKPLNVQPKMMKPLTAQPLTVEQLKQQPHVRRDAALAASAHFVQQQSSATPTTANPSGAPRSPSSHN